MNSYEHGYSSEYRPISAWGYVGLSMLYMVPVIGWLFLIIFTFSRGNINRRNFTRSYWCYLLLMVIVTVVLFVAGHSAYPQLFSGNITKTLNELKTAVTETLTDDNKKPSPLPEQDKPLLIALTERVQSKGEPAVTPTAKPLSQPSKATTVPLTGKGVTPSFKEAMDSYEAFFTEYVDFFDKYLDSENPITMLAEYTKFVSIYPDMVEKMEAMDDRDLSVADAAYYLEVTSRIYKKLGSIIDK